MKLVEEKEFGRRMRDIVEPALAALREEVVLPLASGGMLHGEIYDPAGTQRAVVISHGYTESAEKFREMAWYFLKAGFSVFAVDHRGHGRSMREVEATWLCHIERFDDYVDDLEAFIRETVLPRTKGKTLTLYAHSMGGAIGALMLMREPTLFARAVLTAPMIAAETAPMPRWAGRLTARLACMLGMGKKRAFVGKAYDAQADVFETSCTTSRARFDYYSRKRRENVLLQNNAPSYGWVREALGVTDRLLDEQNAQKIQTPVLLCRALGDNVVCLPEQKEFAQKARCVQIEDFDAKHEIYMSTDDVMRSYVERVIVFLSETAPEDGGETRKEAEK